MLFGLDLAIFGSIFVAELRRSVGFSTLMCSEMAGNLENPEVEKQKLFNKVMLRKDKYQIESITAIRASHKYFRRFACS